MKQTAMKRFEYHSPVLMILVIFVVALVYLTKTSDSVFASRYAGLLTSQTTAQESKQTNVRELKMGESIDQELAGGETHSYRVMVSAGQYLQIVVQQKGIDVVVRMFGPDGKKLSEVDNEPSVGSEAIFVVADAPGEFRVEVQSPNKEAKAAGYEIRITQLRQASARDRVQLAAQIVFEEGNQLRDQQTAESWRKAIKKYEEALPLWRQIENKKGEAFTLVRMGLIYSNSGDPKKALEYYDQAVLLWRALGDRLNEAFILNNIGLSFWRLGEFQKALENYRQALPLAQAAGIRDAEANMLNNIGITYTSLGQPKDGLKYLDEALAISRAIGDRRYETITLNNIGSAYASLGQLREALQIFSQTLPLRRARGDRRGEAVTLNNIAAMHLQLGELQEALDYHSQVLTLRRSVGDRQGEAITLHSLGRVYSQLGEWPKALEYYNQALVLHRANGDRPNEAITLQSVSAVYQQLAEFQKALEYSQQALALSRAVGDRRIEAYELTDIGNIYRRLGEPNKALEQFTLSLSMALTVGDRQAELHILNDTGKTYLILDDPKQALDYHNRALQLSRDIGNRVEEAVTLYGIARAQSRLEEFSQALTNVQAAIEMIESTRSKVISQDLRTSFFASYEEIYEFYIDLLMRMNRDQPKSGYDAVALQTSERARARSLLEILNEVGVNIRQGLDPVLLERERSAQQQLNIQAERLTRLLSGKHNEEQEKAARKQVEVVLADNQDVQSQIRATSPKYAGLTQPHPLTLEEIQAQVLDDNTLMLEYAMGDERSFLWAVTPTSIKSFTLPGRKEIEARTREMYEALTARNRLVRFEKAEDKQVRIARADTEYAAASAILSDVLLGPVAELLGKKRLLIVSNGALQYVPFGALPLASSKSLTGVRRSAVIQPASEPLIINHEIVSLPSASVLPLLRKEMSSRSRSTRTLAVLADPVFQSSDPRVKGEQSRIKNDTGEPARKEDPSTQLDTALERSARDVDETEFRRLPHTRAEANGIVAFTSRVTSRESLDFEANRAAVTDGDLGNYRIIHFATHGFLNSQHPELSGIVLSLVDEKGNPQNGFLRLNEIYNLKLNADLVVLSACRTALGKEIRGEGLVGLTRGFMYAGAPRVVASLWAVDDETTAELMKRFYGEMLVKKQRPAAALRAAQISIWKERRLPPYFWAAFVLQGEWK